jgi:hypothetical protein
LRSADTRCRLQRRYKRREVRVWHGGGIGLRREWPGEQASPGERCDSGSTQARAVPHPFGWIARGKLRSGSAGSCSAVRDNHLLGVVCECGSASLMPAAARLFAEISRMSTTFRAALAPVAG